MIPIRDTIAARKTAWVVRVLVVANVAVFIAELLHGPELEAVVYRFGVVPASWQVSSPADLVHWPWLIMTLFSSQFLHGGPLHLGSNMLYLWIFGDNVEDRLGHARFLGLYLAGGAIAALAQVAIQPSASLPMIGASGAVAGVLGAYFLLFPYAQVVTLLPLVFVWEIVYLPAFLFLGLWFVLQWLQGMVTLGQVAQLGGVAWWAHIGGFLTGLIGVAILRRPARR